jgi:outer membrane protein TolC
LAVQRATLLHEAAQDSDHAASSLLKPDLSLTAQVANNAIDNTIADDQSLSEFTGLSHPAWTVGVTLSMPIGFTAEKARKLSSTADLIRAESGAQQARDEHSTNWINRCMDLFRLERAHEQLQDAFNKQSERSRLEEERFRIGRVGTFQVIQAGDDATFAELNLRSIEVERRIAAWKVRRQAGQAKPWLEATAERLKNSVKN